MKPEQIANLITEDIRSNNGLNEDISIGMPMKVKEDDILERLAEAFKIGNIPEINKIAQELNNLVSKSDPEGYEEDVGDPDTIEYLGNCM